MNTLAKLELPKRWELLEQRAQAAGLDTGLFVERVDSAADRIDYLLQRVKTGGGGLFEVFYGLSGSGKTTFLKTLPKQAAYRTVCDGDDVGKHVDAAARRYMSRRAVFEN